MSIFPQIKVKARMVTCFVSIQLCTVGSCQYDMARGNKRYLYWKGSRTVFIHR